MNGGPIGPVPRFRGPRWDVYSDVNLPQGSPMLLIARDLSTSATFELARWLQAGGWTVQKVAASTGRLSPGQERAFLPLPSERPTTDTPD